MFEQILATVEKTKPLVHNITNYVTVNDVANITLACGGSPIMADDIKEVEEITSICNALVINIGTLNERTIESMILAGKKANELGKPVILDPVGAGASSLRTKTVSTLLNNIQFSVIRGNISEVKTVYTGTGYTNGVDAAASDEITEENLEEIVLFAKELSKKTKAVIAITGKIDVVANETKAYVIRNGHPMMARITGSGCMLTSVIGVFCGANPNSLLESAVTAVCKMGICGEKAFQRVQKETSGTSSFRTYVIDYMSNLSFSQVSEASNIETK